MLGLALLAGMLALWRLTLNEAGFFAPFMALIGVGSVALASYLLRQGRYCSDKHSA